MCPQGRAWHRERIADWGEQAAQLRRIACGRQSALNRAGALEEVVARLEARLAAAGPDPPAVMLASTTAAITLVVSPPAPPRPAPTIDLTRPGPFDGTRAERMRRSAEVCRRLGEHAAARGYDELADRYAAEDDPAIAERIARANATPVPAYSSQMDLFA